VVVIADMVPADWPAVRDIYAQGIAAGDASFDTEPSDWERWDAGHLTSPRLVARDGEAVVGWAALSPVQRKSAYRGVAEVSIYVASQAHGAGVASALAERMVERSEAAGIWTLEAWIFPENEVSLRLCERFGFRAVGIRRRIGRRASRWRDVVVLERRSERV
jgi:phosphinothricin acetyltransferase